jgi:hypothetical protein
VQMTARLIDARNGDSLGRAVISLALR